MLPKEIVPEGGNDLGPQACTLGLGIHTQKVESMDIASRPTQDWTRLLQTGLCSPSEPRAPISNVRRMSWKMLALGMM